MNKKIKQIFIVPARMDFVRRKTIFSPTDLVHVYARQRFSVHTHMNKNKRKSTIYNSLPARISVHEVLKSIEAPKTEKSEMYCIGKRFTKIKQVNKKIHFH